MPSSNHDLSIIICTLGRSAALNQCLTSLCKQTFKNFEVVIVSNTDGLNNLKKYPLNIKTVKDPGLGLSVARDVGWRNASGIYVAWIDDDVIVSNNWVDEIIKTFENNPKIGGVSGPTIIPKNLLTNRAVFWWYSSKNILAAFWVWWFLDNNPYQIGKITKHLWWSPGSNFESALKLKSLIDVDYLEACNMTIRRSLVDQIGGYDLKFKGTSEWCEVDLAVRVKRLGYLLVFNPLVKLEHHVSRSGVYKNRKNLPERLKNYIYFRYKQRFIR